MAMNTKLADIFHLHNPMASAKCPRCGATYDPTMPACPNCGKESEGDQRFYRSFQELPQGIRPIKQVFLALMGSLGFQLLGLLVSLIISFAKAQQLAAQGMTGSEAQEALLAYFRSSEGLALQNYVTYGLLLVALLLILWKDIAKLFVCFKKPKTWLGIPLGFALILISVCWSLLQNALHPGGSTSENQKLVVTMVKATPFFAITITGILGPLCEEITYRLGVFGFLKRINRVLAYLLAAFIFGAIHMQKWGDPNEWWNFPSYLISGFFLAFVYEKFGFGASWLAHSVNNLVSVIQILILAENAQ